MKEVSAKVFALFMAPLAAKGVPVEVMVQGTNVSLATLHNKHERIDWTDTCAIMANLRPYFTDAEYREMGRSYLQTPGLRFAFVVARLLFTPMGFYRFFNKPRQGAGNQMFNCITPKHYDISEHACGVDLTLPEGFEICREFFIITGGNFIEMPRLLGYPAAEVTLTPIARGVHYDIVVPNRARFLTRIRRAVSWPFTVRAAARELQAAHETLGERYAELEIAKTQLAQQARQLTAANQIAALALGDLSAAATMRGVCAVLVEHAGCDQATFTPTDGDAVTAIAELGTDGAQLLHRHALTSGLVALGQLTVLTVSDDAAVLIESLVPTIALVVQKALDQQAIAQNQMNLERRVIDRTSELTRARDELAGSVTRLEEAKASRERLFHNISHEIRTPLSLVLLLVDGVLVHHRAELTDRAVGQMGAITASTRKLVRLVDELLLLASGEARDLQVSVEPIDLARVLPDLTAGWALAAAEAGVGFTVTAPDTLPVSVDLVALERVLSNLLSNAIKFTPRGGAIALLVEDDPMVERVTLVVRDSGIGIDDELRTRLFGRFEQGRGGLSLRSGSGIGLSIARELVRAHGGELTARPNPAGAGTEFVFTLPRTTVQTLERAAPGRLRPTDYGVGAIGPTTTLRPPGVSLAHILIAEDDPGLASAIAQLLADQYTVTLAHDGAAALTAAQTHLPDLLITDVEMPGLDGLELARQVHALPGESATPVIIMSARAKLGDRLAGFSNGAIDYLVKPFDPSELHARVTAQLAHRNLALRLNRTEKLAALGSLSAGLAHELRNPANGIVNAIAPLRELLPPELLLPDSGVAELLDVMTQCAEQVAFVSRQLLGFRRSGELELRRVPLTEVLSRALSNASAALAPVTLRQDNAFSGTLRCAAPLLTQVLVNLLENAAQAAGAGGWVSLESRGSPQAVIIEITDSGPGVPLPLREKVFEPFFTTKPPGQGTGLGLATARDLIHRHGGTLELKMRDDRTVFAIELPQSAEVR